MWAHHPHEAPQWSGAMYVRWQSRAEGLKNYFTDHEDVQMVGGEACWFEQRVKEDICASLTFIWEYNQNTTSLEPVQCPIVRLWVVDDLY